MRRREVITLLGGAAANVAVLRGSIATGSRHGVGLIPQVRHSWWDRHGQRERQHDGEKQPYMIRADHRRQNAREA